MKKFFLIPLMTLAVSVMAFAGEKMFLGVNGLNVAVNDGLKLELQLPANQSLSVNPLNIDVRVSDPLLVDAPCSKSASLDTELNGVVDLGEWLENAYAFGGTQMVVSVKANGASQAFLYDIALSDNVISATANDAKAAEAAWALALSQISKVAQNEGSFIKIAAGSFLQVGAKKLEFAELEMMKGAWGLESLVADMNAATAVFTSNEEGVAKKNVLFIAEGSEFAVGGRKVIADADITITLTNGAALGFDLEVLKGKMAVGAEATIKQFLGLANAFIGYIDAADVNYLTINVGEDTLTPDEALIPEQDEEVVIRAGLKANCYYTVCLPYGVNSYAGGTFFEINQRIGDDLELISVDQLIAGIPYVCIPTGTVVSGVCNGQGASEASHRNGLYGTFENIQVPAGEGLYVFSDYALNPCAALCFLAANRAYVKLSEVSTEPIVPQGQAPARRRIVVGGSNVPMALEDMTVENEGLKKMIENGQLIIVRDGVKYNAQGAIVK